MASSDSLMASPLSEEQYATMASPRAAADDDEELADAAPAPATSSAWATVNTPVDESPLTFYNLDSDVGVFGILPRGVNEDFSIIPQPLGTKGIAKRLDEIYGPVIPDWLRVADDDVPLLCDISGQGLSTNRLIACYGQYLGGGPLDPKEGCLRCLNNDLRAFGTCRVSGFVDGDKRYVLAKGSCMCCLFSGNAAKCSLRATQPTWAVQFLLTLREDFTYEVPDDEEAGGQRVAYQEC
ncbi:hypothetical protein N7467_001975 [Penicillium canescens]|nr:hypothetical protein N7467_001975 [Penicillium canescens]